MKCPVCVEPTLVMSERQGIEIDYCPSCRGIWLDRGELDKLLEKAAADAAVAAPAPAAAAPVQQPPQRVDERPRYDDRPRYEEPRYDSRDPRYGKKKKKKSFLDDIFDF